MVPYYIITCINMFSYIYIYIYIHIYIYINIFISIYTHLCMKQLVFIFTFLTSSLQKLLTKAFFQASNRIWGFDQGDIEERFEEIWLLCFLAPTKKKHTPENKRRKEPEKSPALEKEKKIWSKPPWLWVPAVNFPGCKKTLALVVPITSPWHLLFIPKTFESMILWCVKMKWVFPKIGVGPQIIHFNRVFHYFHHPFWVVFHAFLETSKLNITETIQHNQRKSNTQTAKCWR